MKKLIVLVLILVITPFFIVSDTFLNVEAAKIKEKNIGNSEFKKWEFIKDRVFDENEILQKGYDKPVMIILGKNAIKKDSIVVSDLIKELKTLIPTVIINLGFSKKIKSPYHQVELNFGKRSDEFYRFMNKFDLFDGSIVGKRDPEKFSITDSAGNKYSDLNFDFIENIKDEHRKIFIEYGLLTTIFSTDYMNNTFNNQFPVQMFNMHAGDEYGCFFGGVDKFLLEKLYAPDFSEQFQEYLDEHYPWRYAKSFLGKKEYERKVMLFILLLGLLVFILMVSFFQNIKFKFSYSNYFLPVLLLLFHLCNLYYIYQYLTDFNSFIGWNQNIIFMLTLVPPLALFISLLLWVFDKYLLKDNLNFTTELILKVIYTFIVFNIPLVLTPLMNKKINIYHSDFQDFYYPMLLVWLGLSIGRGILLYLNHFSESLVKQKDVELSRLKEKNAQSELKALQSQINPHFLYNSLNSIASLAPVDSVKTQKMAHSLSEMFKYSINRKGKKMSTVLEEVEMVKTYLEIEKIRFEDRLQFAFMVDKNLEHKEIPLFLIQPLVENAVKHGVSQNEGEGKITLEIKQETNQISISVSDNGPDFPKGLVSGHGLQTVYDLLRLTYGDNASLNWTNTPEKKIMIIIPEIA